MKIGFVRVFVTDLKASLEFYTQVLGMEIDYTDGKHWVQFKSGDDVSLGIEQSDPDRTVFGTPVVGRFVGVTLMVEGIQGLYERLSRKGVEFMAPPEKQPWGGIMVHLRDLDGNILTLMEEGAE